MRVPPPPPSKLKTSLLILMVSSSVIIATWVHNALISMVQPFNKYYKLQDEIFDDKQIKIYKKVSYMLITFLFLSSWVEIFVYLWISIPGTWSTWVLLTFTHYKSHKTTKIYKVKFTLRSLSSSKTLSGKKFFTESSAWKRNENIPVS